MRLVYNGTNDEVQVGDEITLDGQNAIIEYFAEPHKPSSSGRITIRMQGYSYEYYVGVIGAEWIEREDR